MPEPIIMPASTEMPPKRGYVVASGTPEEVARVEASYTGRYLKDYLK